MNTMRFRTRRLTTFNNPHFDAALSISGETAAPLSWLGARASRPVTGVGLAGARKRLKLVTQTRTYFGLLREANRHLRGI